MREEIIKVYDFSLRTDTLYEITEKPDSMAPEEYKKHKTTKALQNRIKNIETGPPYNERMRVWDTGIFAESPMLKEAIADETSRKLALKNIQKHIVEPLENLQGKGTLTHQDNDAQWASYKIEVWKGKVFNTADPQDTLDLLLCLLDKKLTPKEKVSDPHFRGSQYLIVDKEEVFARDTTEIVDTFKITGTFEALKMTNKPVLIEVLNYLNVGSIIETTSDDVLYVTFNNFIKDKNNGYQNGPAFLKACEDMTTTEGSRMISIHNKLKRLILANKIDRAKTGEIFLGDQKLGSNYKAATDTIMLDKKLEKLLATFD